MNRLDSTCLPRHALAGKIVIASFVAILGSAPIRSETWSQTTANTYNWSDVSNWGGISFPNAIGSAANISGDFSGSQTINLNTAITVGSLTLNDSGSTADSGVTLATGTSGSLTLQVASGSASISNSSVSVTNTISAPVVFASDTTINSGTSSSSANFTTLSLSGGFSGSGNITVTGTASGTGRSTVVLGGSNTSYTGNWTLSGTSSTSSQSGAGISISQDGNLGAVPVSPGTNITVSNSGAIRFTAGFTLNANRNILLNSGSTLVLLQDSAATADVAGVISGSGGVRINSGSNTRVIKLSGTNTYTGDTTVTTGKLQAGSTSAFGVNSAVSLANASAALLDLNGFNNAIGSLAGGGANGGNITLGAATLTVGGLNANTSYAGVISGTGSFIKTGTGTQTITSAQTYTGVTTVSSGTLALTGSGSIDNSSGLVIGVGAGSHGVFTTAGQLTFSKSVSFNLTGTLAGLVGSHDLFDFGSAASGDFASVSLTGITTGSLSLSSSDTWTGTFGGYDFTFTETDGVLSVALAAIPEPSSYAALAGVLVLSLVILHSRKRS